MPGTFTDTTDRAVLCWIAGITLPSGWVPPTDVYLALLTSDPRVLPIPPGGDTPGWTNDPAVADLAEVAGTGYSRQEVFWTTATTPSSLPSQVSNSSQIIFGPFTDSAGMGAATTHGALVTTASGTSGLVLMTWQWDNPVAAGQNESVVVPVGALSMTLQ